MPEIRPPLKIQQTRNMPTLFLLSLLVSPAIAIEVLSGDYFRFGTGDQNSVTPVNGALEQPFTMIGGTFMKLTYVGVASNATSTATPSRPV